MSLLGHDLPLMSPECTCSISSAWSRVRVVEGVTFLVYILISGDPLALFPSETLTQPRPHMPCTSMDAGAPSKQINAEVSELAIREA